MYLSYPSTRLTDCQRGFTLIELLAVIVIVAILFTYATLAIRGTEPEEMIQLEARRLDRLIQLALEEAILRGEDYAMDISIDSYRFLRLENQQWVEIKNDKLLRARQLPEDMELELNLEETTVNIDNNSKLTDFSLDSTVDKFADSDDEDEDKENKVEPQFFLLSSGEITPEFSIRLFYPQIETSYLVEGEFDGQHKVILSDL